MTIKGEASLRNILRISLYGLIEIFISENVTPELEKNGVKTDKDALLRKSADIVDRAVSKIIKELEKMGVTSVEELDKKPEAVAILMNKIQEELIEDAKSLQNK